MALRTVKISPVAHALLMARARKRSVSAGALLAELLSDSNVVVPLEPVQRERWEAAAAACGVSLPQFILLRVEALLHAEAPTVTDTQGAPVPDTSWGACCRPAPWETP